MYGLIKYVSKRTLSLYTLLSILYRAQYVLTPFFAALFIDSIVSGDARSALIFGAVEVLLFIFDRVFDYFREILSDKATAEAYRCIHNELDCRVKHYDFREGTIESTHIQQQLGQNYELIKKFIFLYPVTAVLSALMIIAIFVLCFILSPIVAAFIAITVPLASIASFVFGKKISDASAKNLEDMEDVKDFINDRHTLSKQERYLEYEQLPIIKTLLDRFFINALRKAKVESRYNNFVVYAVLNGVILLVTLLTGYLVFVDVISIGMLYAFWLYVSHLWSPMEFLLGYRKEFLEAKPALDAFVALLSSPQISFCNDKIKQISLQDYTATTSDGDRLHNPISEDMFPGDSIAIVGENGVGKTTLIEGILAFNNRYAGKLLINDLPVNTAYSDLLYVLSQPFISKHGVLSEYVDGSDGQKKMMQIDLALKSDKTVLILDEPTNFLDVENKEMVINRIFSCSKERILIIVSHDEEIVSKCAKQIHLKRMGGD